MTSDEIIELWNCEAPISDTDLGRASREIPELHAKYYAMYIDAKREVSKARYLYKRMRHEKNEFLINPTQEATQKYGWEYPDRKILKSDLKDYLDGDSELLKLDMKAQEAELKVETLQEILRVIHARNWLIKNALDDRSFLHGE